MKYFTSIERLRNSTAVQSRVDSVERNLKTFNKDWRPDWMFPITAVGLSNVVDDVHWVYETNSVCIPSGPKDVYSGGGARIGTMTEIHAALKKQTTCEANELAPNKKTEWCYSNLDSLDMAISELAGVKVSWTQGLTFEQAADASAPMASVAKPEASKEKDMRVPGISIESLDMVKDLISLMDDAQKADIRQFVNENCPEAKVA